MRQHSWRKCILCLLDHGLVEPRDDARPISNEKAGTCKVIPMTWPMLAALPLVARMLGHLAKQLNKRKTNHRLIIRYF